MRIVGGTLGGRRFSGPRGDSTRPTSERVREAIASALHSRGALTGATVLDLFAGTGALSFEALSRGAKRANLVECDGKALRAIRKAADELGLSGQITTRKMDVFRTPEAAFEGAPFDLVFVDPPYARAGELGEIFDVLAERCPDALVVVEQDIRSGFDFEAHSSLSVIRRYEYGDTLIVFAEPS